MITKILFRTMVIIGVLNATILNAQSPELTEALNYLNSVRANPDAYSGDIGVSLSGIKSMHPLVWNSNLAIAAQRKAEDMANRNYFGHVDPEGYGMNYFIQQSGYTLIPVWLDNKSNNYFESLSAGNSTPKDAIINLISDGNEPIHSKAGHRLHLLAITDFYKNCYDIGIGWAYNKKSTYKYYYCVIIAKHDW
jgi:uncharacterized protein YkwD